MMRTLNKIQTGAPANCVLPGTTSQRFDVFNTLKVTRALYFKDRKHYILRLPAAFVNGYASNSRVSITPGVSNGKAFLLVGLTETNEQNTGGE